MSRTLKKFIRDMFITSFVTCFRAVFNKQSKEYSIGERVFAAIFLLAFVLGSVVIDKYYFLFYNNKYTMWLVSIYCLN